MVTPKSQKAQECARIPESFYRDRLMAHLNRAEKEVQCQAGRADIVTPEEIIEVKRLNCWREGVGQLYSYGLDFPLKQKRLHILVPRPEGTYDIEETIKPSCKDINIQVSWEYEDDEVVEVRAIGGKKFYSDQHLTEYINSFRDLGEGVFDLKGEELEFILLVINSCHWVEKKFKGEVDQIRVKANKLNRRGEIAYGHFKALSTSGTNEWANIRVANYAERAFINAIPKKEIVKPDPDYACDPKEKIIMNKWWISCVKVYKRFCYVHEVPVRSYECKFSQAFETGIKIGDENGIHSIVDFDNMTIGSVNSEHVADFESLGIYCVVEEQGRIIWEDFKRPRHTPSKYMPVF